MKLPPPTGRPVASAPADPWAEQARRHVAHVAERRRRRRRRVSLVALAVLCAGGGVAAVAGALSLRGPADDDVSGVADGAGVGQRSDDEASAATSTAAVAAGSGLPSVDVLASVDEAWLLDRQDGRFDWGVLVSSRSDGVIGDMAVTVRFLDADDETVHVEGGDISALAPDRPAALGGTTMDLHRASPVRIEVDVLVDDVDDTADGTDASLIVDVVDARIVGSGRLDEDGRLTGALDVRRNGGDPASSGLDDGTDIAGSVVALWRDGDDEIVAAVVGDVSLVVGPASRPVSFALDLERGLVPSGLPDDLTWSRSVVDR